MPDIFAIYFFILGVAIGSFLNVIIYRFGTGRGINGRSMCFSCGKTLHWFELVPLFSFLVQRRRCRGCKAKLSWQYPTVEFATGLVFLFTYFKFAFLGVVTLQSFTLFILALISWSILIVIFVYDMKHKIIPDSLAYTFAGISLLAIFISENVNIWNILAGPILFLPFYLLWKVSGGRWIGLGDGKLALGIGWMLGLAYGTSAVILSFWIGAVISLFLIGISRLKVGGNKLTIKSEIPFAPYLIVGLALVYFLQLDVIGVRMLL